MRFASAAADFVRSADSSPRAAPLGSYCAGRHAMDLLARAVEIAARAHAGAVDKAGAPYGQHGPAPTARGRRARARTARQVPPGVDAAGAPGGLSAAPPAPWVVGSGPATALTSRRVDRDCAARTLASAGPAMVSSQDVRAPRADALVSPELSPRIPAAAAPLVKLVTCLPVPASPGLRSPDARLLGWARAHQRALRRTQTGRGDGAWPGAFSWFRIARGGDGYGIRHRLRDVACDC